MEIEKFGGYKTQAKERIEKSERKATKRYEIRCVKRRNT